MQKRLSRNKINFMKLLCAAAITAGIFSILAPSCLAGQAIAEPGSKKGVLDYPFDDVWNATEQLLKDKALLEPLAKQAQNVKINIIEDKDSGFISGNYLFAGKYSPTIISHVFLIEPAGQNKCRIYYSRMQHNICGGNNPIQYYDGRCWGELWDVGIVYLDNTLGLMEEKIKENNGKN